MNAPHAPLLHSVCISALFVGLFGLADAHADEKTRPTYSVAPAPTLQNLDPDFVITLPSALNDTQRGTAERILAEAAPKLKSYHTRLMQIMSQLQLLSFAEDTPQDALTTLGTQLVQTRDQLLKEMLLLNSRLEQEIGVTPLWGDSRGCGQWNAPFTSREEPEF